MIRAPLLAVALALSASSALAVVPRPGPGDPRIHVVDYDPSDVVELRSALGFQLSVELIQPKRSRMLPLAIPLAGR